MRKILLGVKIIGIFFIISAIWNCITQITMKNYILAMFFLSIDLTIGVNLLRRREFARKLTIFIATFSIISFIILMVALPITSLKVYKNYKERQILYGQLIDNLNKLKNKNGSKTEIANTEEKLLRLKKYIEWYPSFEKSTASLQEHFSVRSGVIYLSLFGAMIYYLKKSYVRSQFE